MSKIFPKVVADTIRANTDELIKSLGQVCTLYKVSAETTDKLGDLKARTFDAGTSTFVLIHWSPTIRRLRALGLYVEGAPLPILGYFIFNDEINIGDYIEIEHTFSIGTAKTNKFTIEDAKTVGQGTETRVIYILAPKRS